ncbi:dynein heavy chain 1, cytosolic [Puccinia sorghi]|uniref:Dynein heavy chain 1, cytosolic n=1 Tax=Puccinia sorghi TaxID=27349 RepID=A0A0L6UK55_9BASI|nr:dynein heavy chain 1, cytosolic [Puccinia sorghi]
MGRIFVGLFQVGTWGCFDEANRSEERILSAVSQQIQSIQQGLEAASVDPNAEVELVGKTLKINPHTGIFITMNPGYAGPMTHPDRELIAQVMLFSQGFCTAEALASKVVPFFSLCDKQLSKQPHYDFGLRALKVVLTSAGHLKCGQLQLANSAATESLSDVSDCQAEQEILIQSVTETIVPKLVAALKITDTWCGNASHVFLSSSLSLLADVFPGIEYSPSDLDELKAHICAVAAESNLVVGDVWSQKHGGFCLWRCNGSKAAIYGTLDPTTCEWNNGLFTNILRKIIDNVRGEDAKRHWIIFDGDVDPEWVENLNSCSFVSRCGIVWFSEDAVTPDMFYENYLKTTHDVALDAIADCQTTSLLSAINNRGFVSLLSDGGSNYWCSTICRWGQSHHGVHRCSCFVNFVFFNQQDNPECPGLQHQAQQSWGDFLRDHSGLDMPPLSGLEASLIDYDVQVLWGLGAMEKLRPSR